MKKLLNKIDMKQTVEEVAREAAEDCYECHYDDSLEMRLVKEAFRQGAEWQSKQSPWISVNERLPENEDMVFTLCKVKRSNNYFICVNNYIDGEWEAKALVYYDTVYYDTVAWMPIPSFDDILEANRDVLERIKEKGD